LKPRAGNHNATPNRKYDLEKITVTYLISIDIVH